MKKKKLVSSPGMRKQYLSQLICGRGCCDSRDHADPHRLPMPVSDPRQDIDTTEPSAPR